MTPLARHLLGRVPKGTTIPRYGSDEWDTLPEQDPRRAAAVALAAECWRDHLSPGQVAIELNDAMVAAEIELRRRVRECSWDVSAAIDWDALASRPTFAELQHRRGVAS